jgi:hypothetical protein
VIATRRPTAIIATNVVSYSGLAGEEEAGTAFSVRKRLEAAQPMLRFQTAGQGRYNRRTCCNHRARP